MRSLYFQLILFSCGGFFLLKAQTNALNIRWDVNPEPDMYQYHLYRSTNNLYSFQLKDSITHPDSNYCDQDSIIPGNLYAYTLVAVDSGHNQSDFSDTVAVGIPRIKWALSSISNLETTRVQLIDIIEDPDNFFMEDTLKLSRLNHVGFILDEENLYLFAEPAGYYGPASLSLKVNDPIGFWDSVSVNITVENDLLTQISTDEKNIPLSPVLFQNFPNPFNSSTIIRFGISSPGNVSLILYSILGEKMKHLQKGWLETGYYQIELDCSDLAGGIYFVSMRVSGYHKSMKIFLQK